MPQSTSDASPFAATPATLIAPMIAMLEEMDKQVERWTDYAQAQLAETIKVSRALRQQQLVAAKSMLEAVEKATAGAMEMANAWGRAASRAPATPDPGNS